MKQQVQVAAVAPTRKVTAAGLAGALMVGVAYVLRRYGVELSAEEASALTVVLTVLAGYLTPYLPADS